MFGCIYTCEEAYLGFSCAFVMMTVLMTPNRRDKHMLKLRTGQLPPEWWCYVGLCVSGCTHQQLFEFQLERMHSSAQKCVCVCVNACACTRVYFLLCPQVGASQSQTVTVLYIYLSHAARAQYAVCACFQVAVREQMMLTDADWAVSRLSAQLSCLSVGVRLDQIPFIVEAVYLLLYNNRLWVRSWPIYL